MITEDPRPVRLRFLRENAPLTVLAAIAISIVIVRACLQSITIDEADSCLIFAKESWPAQWYPSSGNHVLNTILVRLLTTVFPLNEFTVRIPAILGAAIYIGSAIYACRLITSRKGLQDTLFTCLVFNPLLLDYLVAARGYSLAVGFLTAAIALFARAVMSGKAAGNCFWISILLALSFSANFSFAIVCGTVLVFVLAWCWRAGMMTPRIAVSCLLPGFIVAFVLAGSVALTYPKSQLYFGSHSVQEMWLGLRDNSFDELNPEVLNPMLFKWMASMRTILPLFWAFTLLSVLVTIEVRRIRRPSALQDPLLTLIRLLAAVAGTTFLVHWLAFHAAGLLLPKDRTALFFVPLLTIMFGAGVEMLYRLSGRAAGLAAATVLGVAAVYFCGCLRLGYFKEWKFDADTKHVYWLVNDLRHRCGITDFITDWRYTSSLNFYRRAYDNASLPQFTTSISDHLPPGRTAYVIYYPTSVEFIRDQHLNVIYHGGDSEAAVAVRGSTSDAHCP
jgi:hypothetical protein